MKFNLILVDPPGDRFAHFLFDQSRYLAYTLESLGHDCSITRNGADPGRVNIFVNAHRIDSTENVKSILASGLKYVVFQSERIAGRQVNEVVPGEHFERCYMPLLRGALRVWEFADEHVALLAAEGIAADRLEFGYHPAMEEIRPKRNRDIDFLWYGSITPHRRDVLEALARRGYLVRADFDSVALYRNDLIARARVVLTLQQGPEQKTLPLGRILYLVNNRALVAGELAPESHRIDDCMVGTRGNDVIELLSSLMAGTDRARLADENFERLRTMPMTAYVEPLLEKLAGKA